jgi:hypothetical protein
MEIRNTLIFLYEVRGHWERPGPWCSRHELPVILLWDQNINFLYHTDRFRTNEVDG